MPIKFYSLYWAIEGEGFANGKCLEIWGKEQWHGKTDQLGFGRMQKDDVRFHY